MINVLPRSPILNYSFFFFFQKHNLKCSTFSLIKSGEKIKTSTSTSCTTTSNMYVLSEIRDIECEKWPVYLLHVNVYIGYVLGFRVFWSVAFFPTNHTRLIMCDELNVENVGKETQIIWHRTLLTPPIIGQPGGAFSYVTSAYVWWLKIMLYFYLTWTLLCSKNHRKQAQLIKTQHV